MKKYYFWGLVSLLVLLFPVLLPAQPTADNWTTLENKLMNLRIQIGNLRIYIDSLTKNINDLEKALTESELILQDLIAELEASNKKLTELLSLLDAYEKQYQDLKNENNILKAGIVVVAITGFVLWMLK